MIACDLARAVLVMIMALPGMPVAGNVCLLVLVTLVGAPSRPPGPRSTLTC